MSGLFHGTRAGFKRGGFLFPVAFHGTHQRPGHVGEDSTEFIYLTDDRDQAAAYAYDHPGRGRPKILTVQPSGPIERDPSTFDGERGCQYRSRDIAKVIDVEVLP